jgi:hypothetical protein
VRRAKAALSSGCEPHPATAPAGSNRSSHGGSEVAEALDQRVTNERYLSEIVEPTVDDFRSKPSNVRIAFLRGNRPFRRLFGISGRPLALRPKRASRQACGAPKAVQGRKRAIRLGERGCQRVQACENHQQDGLEAVEVHERPPAMAGRMMAGISMLGSAILSPFRIELRIPVLRQCNTTLISLFEWPRKSCRSSKERFRWRAAVSGIRIAD